jgi:phage baseplate assembly protein W
MSESLTYGINFPFRQSTRGKYLSLSQNPDEEIRTDLIHLILTRKGSRYYLPDFGTRLYEFIFEPMDGATFESIREDLRSAVETYLPNVILNNIEIVPYVDDNNQTPGDITFPEGISDNESKTFDIYRSASEESVEYTAKVKIDYTIQSDTFETRDFIILNI